MVELNYVEHIARESVRKILRKKELKPWRLKSWVILEDGPDFPCATEEVVDEYTTSASGCPL